jgi:hypothetical protein
VKVKESEHWEERIKLLESGAVKDYSKIEVTSDWTFSTAYKGSLSFLSNHVERIKNFTSLEIPQDL